jgi:hypothetical protein
MGIYTQLGGKELKHQLNPPGRPRKQLSHNQYRGPRCPISNTSKEHELRRSNREGNDRAILSTNGSQMRAAECSGFHSTSRRR